MFLIDSVDFSSLIFSILVFLGLPGGMIVVSFLVGPYFASNEKWATYECGYDPFQNARIKFEIHFYIIGILFLLFDIELAYLLLWSLIVDAVSVYGYSIMLFFLILLVLSFSYDWKVGALDWY